MSLGLSTTPSAKPSETLTLKVTDLARGGAGVSRDATGRVVFVPMTAPGDEVLAELVNTEKRFAQGRLLKVLDRSSERVEPRCPVFGQCGGCQWQHLTYERQWKTKSGGVLHALSRVGLNPSPSTAVDEFPAKNPWNYRNRIQLRGDRTQLGFFAPKSHALISADGCAIARPEINAEWSKTRAEGAKLPRPYKVELEVDPNGHVQKSWNASHSAQGFRQINDEQNQALKLWITLHCPSGVRLIDLFGGSGNLSASLEDRFDQIDCVDTGAPSHSTHPKLRFHRGDALPWLLRRRTESATTAIIDPPREGLGSAFVDIAGSLEKMGVSSIFAIGCDPDSWARDLSRWAKRGWVIERIALFDFFPQTPHIESAALIRRPIR